MRNMCMGRLDPDIHVELRGEMEATLDVGDGTKPRKMLD